MPTYSASRELLASREDVWLFLAEPRHLADWWPGVAAIEPDRRGLAPGARWRVITDNRPTLLRKPNVQGGLLVIDVEPPARWTFQLLAERIDVELRLEEIAPGRTRAILTVDGPWLIGLSRRLPQRALVRLHALCQTAASL